MDPQRLITYNNPPFMRPLCTGDNQPFHHYTPDWYVPDQDWIIPIWILSVGRVKTNNIFFKDKSFLL